MTKQHHKSARIGVYECRLDKGFVVKGKWVKGYYGLFRDDLLRGMIIPDLKDAKRAGWDFEFPVLVVSYYLGGGDPPKPLSNPTETLGARGKISLIAARRMVGIAIRRKKIAKTETWKVVITAEGQSLEVEGHRLRGS